jgi:hypothetical protein
VDRHIGKRRRKEVRGQALVGRPSPSPSCEPADTAFDRDVVIENINPTVISAAELDVIEQFFDDIVMRALGR